MAAILSIAMIEGGVMPKEEWGVKRVCPTTGKRFYDLGKQPDRQPLYGRGRRARHRQGRPQHWWPTNPGESGEGKPETEDDDLVLDDDIDIDDR
jgi:hypothetical protein